MTSLVYIDDDSQAKVWRAVIVSLALHALVVAVYPTLSHIQLPVIPERLEIEFFTMKMPASRPSEQQVAPSVVAAAPPEPQKTVTTVKPQTAPPVEKRQSVITAPSADDASHQVPEQSLPAKTEQVPAANTAATSSSSEAPSHAANEPAKESHSAPAVSAPTSSETDELTASDNDAWGDYGEQLRSLVNKSKQYPAIAIRRHLEGEVTILAQFVRGELVQVSLTETSKHAPLDEEAVRMVKKAIQQLGVKESLKKKTFKITIPVSFKLE